MNSQPLYREIAITLIKQIHAGEFLENQKLPSERQLAQTYNVSRFTINSALSFLEEHKYIYTLHGSGSFVAPKKVPISLNSFYSFDIETSKHDTNITNKVLACETMLSTPYISHKMNIALDTQIYKVLRLRYVYNTPIMLQTTYLPCAIVPFIQQKALQKTPLYQYLQTEYALYFSGGKETIYAYTPTIDERNFLKVGHHIPCLKIERISDKDDTILEFTESVIRGDKYSFEIEF